MTDASIKAIANLRNPANFDWNIIPILVFVMYIYINEAEKKNWGAVVTGLLFWGGEFIWEMFNSLILHFSQYAGMWSAPGKTTFLIYSGLNIEISLMFAVAGVLVVKILPEDRSLRVLNIPLRFLTPFMFGVFAVFVEVLLNRANVLVWDYSWWSWPNIWLIVVAYTGPFVFIAWLHDRFQLKTKVIMMSVIWSLAVVCHLIFAVFLKWI